MRKPKSILWARLTGCFDSTGKVCPSVPKPSMRASQALAMPELRDPDHLADMALYRRPSSIVTVAPGRPVAHYRVCTDPPVMGRHVCRTADSTTLPAAVQTAALTAIPAMTPGQAPTIIEISQLDEGNTDNA